ncbi:MAG: UTP--glucose-1-phosphate uridylyltransferase [Akkermansia sp.]|nr:UTP--glucose-1-phosphate uridylyltransferase [Akkermansia sp.]
MNFDSIERKMQGVGLSRAAIDAFRHSVGVLTSDQSMMIPETEIEPARDVADWDALVASTPEADAALLSQAVLVKLNGGLGTGMGLQKAKSLLEIKPGVTFLDTIVRQVQNLREKAQYPVSMLLMNSFSTSEDTMAHLAQYADFADAAQVEMLQNRVPKLVQETLEPVEFPANPELEWCPPGHGDIYPALVGSGWLEKLLAAGVKYAFVSNSDNLGAQLDTRFLRWFAESGAPFVMEVTRRTEADKKGGHLATRKADGQPILREVAQCPAEDIAAFQDIEKHQYFNTNNLWIRLDALQKVLEANGGVLPLPVICNSKTVDPRDASTQAVYQLETAMGAALQCFPGARAVCVPRSRFFPVKTCSDLLLLRSDAVEIDAAGAMKLAPECEGVAPVVLLDGKLYKLVESLENLGVPSLKHVSKLVVSKPHTFAPGEPLSGEVCI